MGGQPRTNMKLISATLFVAIAISLHSTDAACHLPVPTHTAEAAETSMFAVLSGTGTNVAQSCTAACNACGWGNVGADAGTVSLSAAPAYDTAAEMLVLGNSICPTIEYDAVQTDPLIAGGNCGAGVPNFSAAAYVTILQNTDANAGADDPDEIGNNSGLSSTATSMCGTGTPGVTGVAAATVQAAWNPPGADAYGTICPCLVAGATGTRTACTVCTCDFFGVPTAAPTATPTMAPTTLEPTSDGSGISYTAGDNELSGGAIAGIVIGSIVGAALIIGAGVMIGSK